MRTGREYESAKAAWGVAAFLFFLIMLVPLGLLKGLCVSVIWAWFVVPLGVPAIGVLHAWGLVVLWGLITADVKRHTYDECETGAAKIMAAVLGSLITCGLVTGIAALIHCFM